MTDFIATSVKYYLLSKSKGKVVLDAAKTGSNSKSQEPKAQAKVAVAVEENGNDDPFARNQKELQEAVAQKHVKAVQNQLEAIQIVWNKSRNILNIQWKRVFTYIYIYNYIYIIIYI